MFFVDVYIYNEVVAILSWEQYGLKNNPYDTLPLVEGGDLPIEKAFVGREKERESIDRLLGLEDHLCLTVLGEVGVGKTSLANFQKFIWKYKKTGKCLFSFRREVEAREALLEKEAFILEIVGSVLREIELLDPDLFKKERLLQELNQMVDITQSMGISGGLSGSLAGYGLGVDFAKEKTVTKPLRLSISLLEKKFSDLLEFLMKAKIGGRVYGGLIVHTNNFDVVMRENPKKVINFFDELRDFLQTKNVYFIFLGPTTLFTDIISTRQRVKSIFHQNPLVLSPLSKKQVVRALERRLEFLKSENVQRIIKPVDDDVIYELYDLYSGDIRSIVSSLKDVVLQLSDKLPRPLRLDEAMLLLGQQRMTQLSDLSQEQLRVVSLIAQMDTHFTQTEVAKILDKDQANVSGYYFKPLIERGVIELIDKKGRTKYWSLTRQYLPLTKIKAFQKTYGTRIATDADQLELFESNR